MLLPLQLRRHSLVLAYALIALVAAGCTTSSIAQRSEATTPQEAVEAFLRAFNDADATALIATLDPAEAEALSQELQRDFDETFEPLGRPAPEDLLKASFQDLLDELGATATGLEDDAPIYETTLLEQTGRQPSDPYASVFLNGLKVAYDRTVDTDEVLVVVGRRVQAPDPSVHSLELRYSSQGSTAWHLGEDGLPIDAYNLQGDDRPAFFTVERDGSWYVSLRSDALSLIFPEVQPLAVATAPVARFGEPVTATPSDGFSAVAASLDGGTKTALTRSSWVSVARLTFDESVSFVTHHHSERETSRPLEDNAWAVIFDDQYDVAFPAIGAITKADVRVELLDAELGEIVDGYVGEIGPDGRPQLFRWEWTSSGLKVSGANHLKLTSGNGNTAVILDAANGTGEAWGDIVVVWGEPGSTFEFSVG